VLTMWTVSLVNSRVTSDSMIGGDLFFDLLSDY
jgi:hypothetical protein